MTEQTQSASAAKPRKIRLLREDERTVLGRAGLHERVADRLRVLIVRRDLLPGARIAETGLCEQLGVSRTPLREALKLLAAEGLVELRPNRSPRVQPMRVEEIAQLFEAVSGVERIAAELAAARLDTSELKRLAVMQSRIERHHLAGERDAYFQNNQKIHRFIVAGAKNPVLRATHEWLLARAERARYFALSAEGRWDESVAEHRAILDALEQRDAEAAGRLLGHHVHRTGEVVVASLRASGLDEGRS